MRTTLDLDPKLLEQVEELTGETSRSKAVNKLMAEAVRKKKLVRLRELLDTSQLVDDWRERKEMELRDMEKHQR